MFRPFLIYSILDNHYSQRNKNPKFHIFIAELLAREERANVAPYLTKCGNLPIQEILVIT